MIIANYNDVKQCGNTFFEKLRSSHNVKIHLQRNPIVSFVWTSTVMVLPGCSDKFYRESSSSLSSIASASKYCN